MRRGAGAIRTGVSFALLFASLSMVVWRQSRALEELSSLDRARAERAQLQAEWSALQREIQYLESRSRVVEVAAERLAMRVPTHSEIVLLIAPVPEPAERSPRTTALLSAGERR